MNNKKLGNNFEKEFCKILSEHGFWVHNIVVNQNGQPFDVIACMKNCIYVFDCKVCENDSFDTSRIEENQIYAMKRFMECGNTEAFFALKLSDSIYLLRADEILNKEWKPRKKRMNKKQIEELVTLEDYIEAEKTWI